MKRQTLILSILAVMLVCGPLQYAQSANGGGHRGGGGRGHGSVGIRGVGHGFGHGFGRGFGGIGFGFGGFNYGWDIAELYRELYQNLPFYALHPPVYYSGPVPRPYGYSPFAYPPGVMTPEIGVIAQPVTIDNPYAPKTPATPTTSGSEPDRAAASERRVEPLVILNPYAPHRSAVASTSP